MISKLTMYTSYRFPPQENSLKKLVYMAAIRKNAFESVLMRWMKLESIIQTEVSQKEKHQYSILMHIHEI